MSLKSKQGQSICKSSTLAKMLVVPNKEIKGANVDNISFEKSFHDKLSSNDKPARMVGRKDLLEVYEGQSLFLLHLMHFEVPEQCCATKHYVMIDI